MTDEPQPELRWAPLPPKPNNRGRMWLIVGLAIAALVIVGVVLFFLLPRGEVDPDPTPSPSSSATATPTPTPTPTPSPTTAPTDPPIATEPPPVVDPGVDAFRGQVSGPLDDAGRGLDYISSLSGQDALSVLDTLQEDAQRLSDTQPPSSISSPWRDGLAAYGQRLSELRTAVAGGAGTAPAVDAARTAVQNLRNVVGL